MLEETRGVKCLEQKKNYINNIIILFRPYTINTYILLYRLCTAATVEKESNKIKYTYCIGI